LSIGARLRHDALRAPGERPGYLADPSRRLQSPRIQKNGERDSPRLCRRQSGILFGVEQWAGGSAGQLLETAKTHHLRESKLRSPTAARPLPHLESSRHSCVFLPLWWLTRSLFLLKASELTFCEDEPLS